MLLDFYGTLARAVRWGPRFEDVLDRWGLRLPDDGSGRWWADADDGREHPDISTDRDAYVAWEHARLRRLTAACGAPDDDELVAHLYAASKDFELEPYEEVPAVLEELLALGVPVAVCSNWDWDLDRALEQAGIDHLVGPAVTSARAGARKPHPRIFTTALEAVGVEPGAALFAGDTWHADVEGAVAVGMEALHVRREDAPAGDPPPLVPGTHRAADLVGVLALVGGWRHR